MVISDHQANLDHEESLDVAEDMRRVLATTAAKEGWLDLAQIVEFTVRERDQVPVELDIACMAMEELLWSGLVKRHPERTAYRYYARAADWDGGAPVELDDDHVPELDTLGTGYVSEVSVVQELIRAEFDLLAIQVAEVASLLVRYLDDVADWATMSQMLDATVFKSETAPPCEVLLLALRAQLWWRRIVKDDANGLWRSATEAEVDEEGAQK